jgi:hypothetical protein
VLGGLYVWKPELPIFAWLKAKAPAAEAGTKQGTGDGAATLPGEGTAPGTPAPGSPAPGGPDDGKPARESR